MSAKDPTSSASILGEQASWDQPLSSATFQASSSPCLTDDVYVICLQKVQQPDDDVRTRVIRRAERTTMALFKTEKTRAVLAGLAIVFGAASCGSSTTATQQVAAPAPAATTFAPVPATTPPVVTTPPTTAPQYTCASLPTGGAATAAEATIIANTCTPAELQAAAQAQQPNLPAGLVAAAVASIEAQICPSNAGTKLCS